MTHHKDLPIGSVRIVANLPDLQFLSDSQDVQAVKDYIGKSAFPYDAFFVSVSDGDYSEVWGIIGIVPYLSKLTTKLL